MSKEPKINIIYSPKDQGLDRYFEIAKTANKGTVYVWFEGEQGVERMWVQITKGNNKNGGGVLISDPVKLTEISMGNYVMFKQDKDTKVVEAKHVFEGRFCRCCGESMDNCEQEEVRLH